MNTLVKKIKDFVNENPKVKQNYTNINPYFGIVDNNGILKTKIYIGYDFIINIYDDVIYLENENTGKITKRKL